MLEPNKLHSVEEQDQGNPEIDAAVESTAVGIKEAMEKIKGSNDDLEIAGVKIEDNHMAVANMEAALAALSKHYKIDKDRIFLQKFSGNLHGESRESGVYIDPANLMNLSRLVYVMAHELSHKDSRLKEEAIVDAYARAKVALMGFPVDTKLSDDYEEQMKRYEQFVKGVKKDNETVNEAAIRIYEMYDDGKYEEIYEIYFEKVMRGKKAKEQENNFQFFKKIFTELDWEVDGRFHLERVAKIEEEQEVPAEEEGLADAA